jgi:hypothetical protein
MNEPEDDDLFNPFYLSQRDVDLVYEPTDPGLKPGWYYCLPDGTRVGPFDSEAEAASEAAGDDRAAEEEAD